MTESETKQHECVEVVITAESADHADEVPCVIALDITNGHPAYLQWIYEETVVE